MHSIDKIKPLPGCFPFSLDLRGLVVEGRRIPRRGIVYNEPGFIFVSKELGPILVETGFDTDFASVPKLFWNIFPPDGEYTEAALIHDALYWYQATAEKQWLRNDHSEGVTPIGAKPVTREQADGVFLEAMEALGIGFLTRQTLYRAVRLGGGAAWAENAREKAGLPRKQSSPTTGPRRAFK